MLEPKVEIQKLRTMYQEDPRRDTTTVLLCGEFGTGKTRFAKTCPAPVLVHCFDPRGEQTLKAAIEEGRVIVDNRYEYYKSIGRRVYKDWTMEMERLSKGEFFTNIGTLVIDSFSTFSVALLEAEGGDWQAWSEEIRRIVSELNSLPCNIVLTSHIEIIKDEVTGKAQAHMYTPGRVKYWVPGLFSEVYVLQALGGGASIKYTLLTRNNGFYRARTRIGADIFDFEEVPDMKVLLKKAGYPYEDKPLFLEDKKEKQE